MKYRAGSSIASLSQLGELKRYTEKLLGDMAAELHNGRSPRCRWQTEISCHAITVITGRSAGGRRTILHGKSKALTSRPIFIVK